MKGENGFRCDISENTGTPLVTFGTVITIENCDINNNNGYGLAMYYPNNEHPSSINNSEINENSYYGLYFYQAPVELDNCLIEMNRYHGIVSLHNANPKLKDCTIQNNGNPLYGSNNGVEILATYDAFPLMYKDNPLIYTQGMNTIYDEIDGGDDDHYLLWAGSWETGMRQIPVWGNFFLNSNDPGFSDRFYPFYNTFQFIELSEDPRTAYDTAQSKIIAGNYEDAKIDFKNLISDYPDEDYFVTCSLNWLLFLEKFIGNDYVELRDYVEGL